MKYSLGEVQHSLWDNQDREEVSNLKVRGWHELKILMQGFSIPRCFQRTYVKRLIIVEMK